MKDLYPKLIFSSLVWWLSMRGSSAVLEPSDEEYKFIATADRYDWSKHPCRRSCGHGQSPKTCYYVFVVEQLYSMGKACYDCPFNVTDCSRPHCIPVDGVHKMLYVVNRQLPGPPIEVCQNDTVVVDVRNAMMAESTTIHWHGIKQKKTPYMDGVPYVNQCPILPGESFRYVFRTETGGTHFWHSHIGAQRGDGLFGALIVHPPVESNPQRYLYDYDHHHMLIGDWSHFDGTAAEIRQFYDTFTLPDTILINGKGRFQSFDKADGGKIYTPIAVFTVEQSKRYRFRVIHAGVEDCPTQISIDNHSMLIISLDNEDIVPVKADVVNLWAGERFDFVLDANQKIDNYWIRFRGFGLCDPMPALNKTGAFQIARLHYSSAPDQDPPSPVGHDLPKLTKNTRVLNPYQGSGIPRNNTNIHIPWLKSIAPTDVSLRPIPDQQIYISYDFYQLDNYDYHRKNLYGFNQVPFLRRIGSLQLNHISLKLPTFPLLSQRDMIRPGSFCNSTTVPMDYCKKEQCACSHVLQVKLNSVVELVFVDEGQYVVENHPLHLHGHSYRVVASDGFDRPITTDEVKQLDRDGKIRRNLNRPPIKDTMRVPQGGYTIVRFHADNPGYWFFHCHWELHSNIGMALIFKVGEHEDFPPVPAHFPKCGNYASNHPR